MKKSSKKQQGGTVAESKPAQVVGLDLGDRYSHYCMLSSTGEAMEEGRIQTTSALIEKHFGSEPRMRIALEACTHSAWVSRLLKGYGHQVIVANPRKIPTLTKSESKNDRNDAEQLARMAAFDPKLLHGIEHRSVERQQDLNLIHTRSVLVRARTMLINSARGLVKSAGQRLPSCSSEAFPEKVAAAVPPALKAACTPLLKQIAQMNQTIDVMDKQIDRLDKKYPEITVLRTAPGVGPVVAACYVLTLDSPQAMKTNRQAGAYLGLRPRQQKSGDSDPQCGITRMGNTYLRSLLVQSAQYILGRYGSDSELRRWGLKLAASGGKRGKKRAVVAVARKLSVTLLSMWRNRKKFEPFPHTVAQLATV
ncbi:MAG: IS110 family transposase [Candidatus Udaeobacter sp.]